MKRTLYTLAVLLLISVFAIGLAYDGFDVEAGTGTLGVGQVQPPGLDTPPHVLTAEKTKTTTYLWDCVLPDGVQTSNPVRVQPQEGVYTETYTADADVRLNPKDMVLNYTFNGWMIGDKVLDADASSAAASMDGGFEDAGFMPACLNAAREVENVEMTVEFGQVSFSY